MSHARLPKRQRTLKIVSFLSIIVVAYLRWVDSKGSFLKKHDSLSSSPSLKKSDRLVNRILKNPDLKKTMSEKKRSMPSPPTKLEKHDKQHWFAINALQTIISSCRPFVCIRSLPSKLLNFNDDVFCNTTWLKFNNLKGNE